MKPLKIGITGVRGIVGETFTPELVTGFAAAFGTYLEGGKILICRDPRKSGAMVQPAVCAGLLSTGCEVIDLGICPTPSLQLQIKHLQAQGGISISGGHNPSDWNALKFVRGDGLFLNAVQAEELLDVFYQGEFYKAKWNEIQTKIGYADAISYHISAIKSFFDVDAIRSRKFKVAVDCFNGSCALLVPPLLRDLGCEVLAINDDPATAFPHNPEPNSATMTQLRALVRAGRTDLGFALDADGERLGLVTETGEILSEEMTLATACEIILRTQKGTVVTNISTSRMVDRIAARHDSQVIRTPIGQAFISEAIAEYNAVVGGEGSGGVAIPQIQPNCDSAATIVMILNFLAKNNLSFSQLLNDIPRFFMLKHNIQIEPNRIYSVLQSFRQALDSEKVEYDSTDGIRISQTDGWMHIRVSNTESLIRIIVEAESAKRAAEMLAWTRDLLKN